MVHQGQCLLFLYLRHKKQLQARWQCGRQTFEDWASERLNLGTGMAPRWVMTSWRRTVLMGGINGKSSSSWDQRGFKCMRVSSADSYGAMNTYPLTYGQTNTLSHSHKTWLRCQVQVGCHFLCCCGKPGSRNVTQAHQIRNSVYIREKQAGGSCFTHKGAVCIFH